MGRHQGPRRPGRNVHEATDLLANLRQWQVTIVDAPELAVYPDPHSIERWQWSGK